MRQDHVVKARYDRQACSGDYEIEPQRHVMEAMRHTYCVVAGSGGYETWAFTEDNEA